MRTTKETRQALEKAAAQSGRSLAQEVEHRLEDSLARERGNYLFLGYANWRAPLIPHKGSLILVLDGITTITMEISPKDMEALLARVQHMEKLKQ
jgi:hypothetical protein